MSTVRTGKSDHVRFILKSSVATSLVLDQEPIGWQDDELEVVRNKRYHGVFTQFSNSLRFIGVARQYIEDALAIDGNNTRCFLTRESLKPVDGEVKWVEDYRGLADPNTRKVKDNKLSIRFNSNDLEELVKSHENDEFELERTDSIDDIGISPLDIQNTNIDGRSLVAAGHSKSVELTVNQGWHISNQRAGTIQTIFVAQGPPRHSSVDTSSWPGATSGQLPSNMFFVDTVAAGETININVRITCRYFVFAPIFGNNVDVILRKLKWNGVDAYTIEEETTVFTSTNEGEYYFEYEFNNPNLAYDEGYVLLFKKQADNNYLWIRPVGEGMNIYVDTVEYYEPSVGLDFIFVHEAFEKLMEIITGERGRFYSRLFGNPDHDDRYTVEGEFAEVGLIHGLAVRDWDRDSDLYKPMKLSIKDLRNSLKTVFNTGIGIETINFKQRLRLEKLEYFYQDRVVVRLPQPVTNIEEETDKDLFFSGIELGYQYGGEYENELGLDEPNTKTSWVTPLRRTKEKYNFSSKIRADEYSMEIIRRQPQEFFPTDDTQQDDHIWFLDLKKILWPWGTPTGNYEQRDWSDRLDEEPTGILGPTTFRSMLFTPLRILFRHGWMIRAGMEQYNNLIKNIKYISSKANTTLSMLFTGESEAFQENEDVQVSKLERSRVLPNKIKFEHPITDDLLDQILGYTEIDVNGQVELVPNTHFKFEWVQDGIVKRGYLLSFKPKGNGKFEMIEANENLITV